MPTQLLGALATFAHRIRSLTGWRQYALAFAAGALSIIGFAPFHLTPVLVLTLPVLLWLSQPRSEVKRVAAITDLLVISPRLTGKNLLRGLAIGWWFGFGFHLAGLYWIGGAFLVQSDTYAWLMPFAVTLLPAGLALFHGLAIAVVACFAGAGAGRLVVLAVSLAATEWLRGNILTGFPWNTLGYALAHPLVLMQSAAVVGIHGLTLAAVFILGAPLVLVESYARQRQYWPHMAAAAAMLVAPLALMLGYGVYALAQPPAGIVDGIKLRLVQPSIAQSDKFDLAKRSAIFERHLTLSTAGRAGARAGLDGITHVIWPEAALAFLALRSPHVLGAIADAFPDDVTLIAGTLRLEGALVDDGRRHRVFNSAMAVGGNGTVVDTYDKIHLVPFGEYLPLQHLLEAIGLEQVTRIRGGFATGAGAGNGLTVPGLPAVRMLICYEVIFPHEVQLNKRRPAVLINLTNDAWYGATSGPYQHFHQSVVRTVEQGLPMIRVGNNGISGVIDARGRILDRLPLNAVGIIDTHLPAALSPTTYARFGDGLFGLLWLLLAIVIIIWSCRNRFGGRTDN